MTNYSMEKPTRKHPKASCETCPLYFDGEYCASKWVPGSQVVFVGEAPGANEVAKQEPFVGESGILLNRAIRGGGGDPETVSKTNVVACRPPNNNLMGYEGAVYNCMGRLQYELAEEFAGDKVVALGKYATEVVLGVLAGRGDAASLPPSARRGRWFDADGDTGSLEGVRILSEYHPAYVARKPSEMSGFKRGIARVFDNGRSEHSLLQEPEIIVLDSFRAIEAMLSRVPDGTWTAFDLETNQIQYYDSRYSKDRKGDLVEIVEPADEILQIGMAWNLRKGYIIPGELVHDDGNVVEYLTQFFRRIKTIAHNGKFDVVFLRSAGVVAHVDFDTMLAHFVLEENSSHGLKSIAQVEYGLPDYEAAIIKQYLKSSSDEWSKIPFDKLALYNGWDCIVTRALKERFEKRLRARKSFVGEFADVVTIPELSETSAYHWPFMNLLMPAQQFLSGVEYRGIAVDVPYLKRAQAAMQQEIDEHLVQLREMCDKPDFNPNAHMQVAEVLYEDLQLPRPKQLERTLGRRVNTSKSKKPQDATGKGVLDALVEVTNHPFARQMKTYRRVAKIKSSYIDNMLSYVDTEGRVHADFRVMGTEVGRLAVKEPALQTIPRPKDRHGATIRGAFVADPYTLNDLARYLTGASGANLRWDQIGCQPLDPSAVRDEDVEAVLMIADYSQAELRAAAHYSNEPFLIDQVYANDRDLHTEATNAMFGTPEQIAEERGISYEEAKVLWDEYRVELKMFNFAYLYGGNENSFAQDRGIPLSQAKAFVKRYESNMPRLAQWKKDQYRRALKYHYVTTVHGRRRTFPELAALTPETLYHRDNRQLLDDVRKASVHAVVAGTASDLCLLAAQELDSWGLEIQLLVHDSVIIRAPRFVANCLAVRAPEVMERTAAMWLPRVAWKVDVKIGKRWAKPPEDLMLAA